MAASRQRRSGRRSGEHSDGCRPSLMPFFILPGQVAGVGAGSGVVDEQFTGGKRFVFHVLSSSHGEPVGEVLERLNRDDGFARRNRPFLPRA